MPTKKKSDQQLEHQKRLVDAALAFNTAQDLNALLNEITQTALALVSTAEEALILLPDEHRRGLVLRSYRGPYQFALRHFTFDLHTTLPGRVYQEHKRILKNETTAFDLTPDLPVQAVVYLPLQTHKQLIGVLGICTRQAGDEFSAYDLGLLEQLSTLAALALENVYFQQQSQARSFELALIMDSTEAVNSTLSLAEVLSLIGKSLLKALQAHWCEVMVGRSEQPQVNTWALQRQAIWRAEAGYVLNLSEQPVVAEVLAAKATRHLPFLPLTPEEQTWRKALQQTVLHPVVVGDQVIGLVEIALPNQMTLPIQEIQPTAKLMASHLMVNEVNRVLGSARQLAREYNAAWCSYWQLDGSYLHRVVSVGSAVWTQEPYPVRHLADYPTLQQAAQTHSIMTFASKDQQVPADVRRMLEGLQARVLMIVPLVMQSEQLGVVLVAHTLRENQFESGEIGLAHALILQAANAIKNAQLYADLEHSLDELHRTQARLVQTARLGAIGQLAAAVAHQINNPLTTVLGDTQLILGDIAPDDPNIESLRAINRAGQRAYEVVRRLLSMARQKSADDPPELLNINLTIQNTLALVESTLYRARVQLQLDLTEDLPHAYGIHGQLEDVWLNLILNARDACIQQRKPQIGITSRYEPQQQMVEVSVWDNGPGFNGASTETLFDAFYTTKPPGEGTGLGLYICKQIVERCGGCIIADSTYDQGAMFRVLLPTKRGAL